MSDPILQYLIRTEAISSVALSHPADCRCQICRAAQGDPRALLEVYEDLDDLTARKETPAA